MDRQRFRIRNSGRFACLKKLKQPVERSCNDQPKIPGKDERQISAMPAAVFIYKIRLNSKPVEKPISDQVFPPACQLPGKGLEKLKKGVGRRKFFRFQDSGFRGSP